MAINSAGLRDRGKLRGRTDATPKGGVASAWLRGRSHGRRAASVRSRREVLGPTTTLIPTKQRWISRQNQVERFDSGGPDGNHREAPASVKKAKTLAGLDVGGRVWLRHFAEGLLNNAAFRRSLPCAGDSDPPPRLGPL